MKFVLMLLVSSVSHADLGLDQLKDSFSDWMQNSSSEFDKAEAMKTIHVPIGQEISYAECKALTSKIAANYKVDPFHLRSRGSSNDHTVCGGSQTAPKTNFVSEAKGLSNFSRPYVSVLQAVGMNANQASLEVHNYFLDEKNVIVEIQALYFDTGAFKILKSTSISSLDQAGSLYYSYFDKANMGPGPRLKGNDFTTHVINADGSGRIIRRRVRKEGSSQDSYSRISFERSDKKDWDNVEMMITYRGPYYIYAGIPYDIYSKPNMMSQYSIQSYDGKKHCDSGFVRTPENFRTLPAKYAEYEVCQNY